MAYIHTTMIAGRENRRFERDLRTVAAQHYSALRTRAPVRDLAHDVVSLGALDTTVLRRRRKALFGADPSPHFGRLCEASLIGS